MLQPLEQIIETYHQKYPQENFNAAKGLQFLERRLQQHPQYDLSLKTPVRKLFPYRITLLNDLLLRSYLLGERIIIAGKAGHVRKERIRSIKDLYLLRPGELGSIPSKRNYKLLQTDKVLYHLHLRIGNECGRISAGNWGGRIDELGQDKDSKRYFGKVITYEMVKQCHSPKASIGTHGGDRKSESFILKG